MANKYMDERNYFQNSGKYDCHQASRGYRQNSRPNGNQREIHRSTGVNQQSNYNREPEYDRENEKQCQYLKYPLPPSRLPLKSKPSAAGSHQCQVMVNTPRYYKQKPHRHPSALSIPLLSRPESEIHLKARNRTKKDDESSVKEKRRRAKQRPVKKHQNGEKSCQKQRNMQQNDASFEATSDEDDLRSVSLRAYSSGCLSVDISSQVGDLVKAFNTVSKRHKVKKIVYEEIEPIYQKCELQQLKPQIKGSQRRSEKHTKKPEPNYETDPTEVPTENVEDLESKCTCNNDEETTMEAPTDQGIGEKKDVDRLEKLFLEVFAQGRVEGLPKQKKLDCLQDAYNQYSAALEDFSNNPEIDSEGCILPQHSSLQNYVTTNQYGSESCEEEIGLQSKNEKHSRAKKQYRNLKGEEESFNESIDVDGLTCNEEEIEVNQQVMQCTCNQRNDRSNSKNLIDEFKNKNVIHGDFPYSQTDFSQMLTNQRQNTVFENTAESSFENTNNIQQDTIIEERSDGTYSCSQSNFINQNLIVSQFHNKDSLERIETKNLSITPDSGIARTLNSRLSNHIQEQNENIKVSTPQSSKLCPAPPKLSISDNHFRRDSRHHTCGHLQCYQRSKSKGVEVANMEKRQMMRSKSKDGESAEAQNPTYNQEGPIIQSDFPNEVPANSNRSRTQINNTMLQPRKSNYDSQSRRSEINRTTDNNICNNRTDLIQNVNVNGKNKPSNNATGNDNNIEFNPFLNFLLQNDSNHNMPNIVPENQSVYFCDVTPNLHQQYNIRRNEECDDENTFTMKPDGTSPLQKPINTNFLVNARSSTSGAKWHDMNRDTAETDQKAVNGYENNQTKDDHCKNTQRILDEVRESLAMNSNENRKIKPSECSFEQIKKTCSDQSSYKNYIESIIDHSNEILANNTQTPVPFQTQISKCQTNLKMEGETTTDLNVDDSASQIDSKLNQEISQRLNDRLVHSEKGLSPANLVTLEEPEYLQHLKKLRWDHLRHISREVHRLENLERFLDSCGCGHMMIHKGTT